MTLSPLTFRRLALAGSFVALTALPAFAQVGLPYVPPELHSERRLLRGNTLSVCVWSVSPTVEVDKAVAQAIGETLLISTEIHEYTNMNVHSGDDLWESVYIQLAEQCDAIMGFTMTTQLNIEWLIPSRPYYEAPYVLVVREGEYARLGDIPAGKTVGTTQLTAVDEAMHAYQEARPASERWVRIPFPSNAPILDYLRDGRIEGALMWEPMFARMKSAYAEDDVRFAFADLDPLRAASVPIGMMLREHNAFLRTQIDQAIGSMVSSGRLQEVISSVGAPGHAPAF